MTVEKQNIDSEFYSGNSKIINVTITKTSTGQLMDLSNCEMTYVIINEKENEVVLRKMSNLGQITDTGTSNEIASITINPYDTINIYGSFVHQLNVVDENGHEETVMTGRVRIFRSHARRYRTSNIPAFVTGG